MSPPTRSELWCQRIRVKVNNPEEEDVGVDVEEGSGKEVNNEASRGEILKLCLILFGDFREGLLGR
jgi:hypothetical protein